MLSAFRILLHFLLMMTLTSAFGQEREWERSLGDKIRFSNNEIFNLRKKLFNKNIKLKDRKQFQKKKDNLVLENFKNKMTLKREQVRERHEHARKNEKIDLKYSPKGICKNPCSVNLEAVLSNKNKKKIIKYIFYVDDKAIESVSPKLLTTIYFSKGMLTDKQKKLLTKNVPLHRLFKLRVEGVVSETKMFDSEVKKLVIKSLPNNLTNIELITKSALPFNKIQIATSGINAVKLQGAINSILLIFEVDPSVGSTQVLYALMPNLPAGNYKLLISNFSLDVQINQMPIVSNPMEYINNLTSNAIDLGTTITDGDQFKNILTSDGIMLFSKYNEAVSAFDNYVKNQATPSEIQEIANIINSSTLSDSNVYFFVKNDSDSIREFINLPKNRIFISKIISVFIESSYAQDNLKDLLISKTKEVINTSMTMSFNTIIDGMINKCYVSKGRSVPTAIVTSEKYITAMFKTSTAAVIANAWWGVYGYYSAISAAQALVIVIGNDCEGDSTINPTLVIQSQPLFPIKPGESFQYDVKCDVGDLRYYNPGSILTKVTSRFEYISDDLKETGDLIASDRLLHSCSGLGLNSIKDKHNVFCTTNLLNESWYYQNNSSQYEVFNSSLCDGSNSSYDVGTYLVSDPKISCNFVNNESKVNIQGKSANANQLVFDLSKTWQCPSESKAIIGYTKNNLLVNFNSTDPQNPNVAGLNYSWNFGDGQTANTTSKTISHNYLEPGSYSVSLVLTDANGRTYSASEEILVEKAPGGDASVKLCMTSSEKSKFDYEIFTLDSSGSIETRLDSFSFTFAKSRNSSGYPVLECQCKTVNLQTDLDYALTIMPTTEGLSVQSYGYYLTPENKTVNFSVTYLEYPSQGYDYYIDDESGWFCDEE